jgi:hypothetical protein
MSNIKRGSKYIISNNTQTPNGMVYKGTKVKVEEFISKDKIRVHDEVGRVLWVKSSDILVY